MNSSPFYEASVTEGLETVAYDEIRHRFGAQAKLLHPVDRWPGTLQFTYQGSPINLLQLKTVLSLFLVQPFPVPRPRALLGHQHFTLLMERIDWVRKLSPKKAYQSVYLAAAGSETSVMRRFLAEVAQHTRLQPAGDEGDLLIRLRRPLDKSEGWEALIRMTNRPLSTRAWRVCDYKGALNAAVAHAMVQLTHPDPQDVFLNLACGSGSILIELAGSRRVKLAVGCDINEKALDCARANAAAALRQPGGLRSGITLAQWDATRLPLPDRSVDVLCSDLPFGHHVSTHQDNVALYPQVLKEAARVAKPGARAALLTHEVRLMTALLEDSADWAVEEVLALTLNGLHPRLYLLNRR